MGSTSFEKLTEAVDELDPLAVAVLGAGAVGAAAVWPVVPPEVEPVLVPGWEAQAASSTPARAIRAVSLVALPLNLRLVRGPSIGIFILVSPKIRTK
jgi:hypothetical protein